MITLIILIVLIAAGVYLIAKTEYESLGALITTLLGTYLFIHTLVYITVGYEYELFVQKRNSFEQTLHEARESGNKYEAAAIIKEIADWNQELAVKKYKNKTIFYDQYVDDRIECLKPIK